MKLLSVKPSRNWILKGISLLAILSSLLFFQNCGPGFKVDSSGQVMMSSFADPIEIQTVAPSTVLSVLPSSGKTNSDYQATRCSGSGCNTKVFIGK